MAKRLPALGDINARHATPFWVKGKRYTYDATTVDLVNQAAKLGLKPGDRLRAIFIDTEFLIVPNGGGDRTTNGWWAEKVSFVENWKRLGLDREEIAYLDGSAK